MGNLFGWLGIGKLPSGNKPLAGSASASVTYTQEVAGSPYIAGGQVTFIPSMLNIPSWAKQLGVQRTGVTASAPRPMTEAEILAVHSRKRESYRPWTWRTFGKDMFAAATGFGFGFSSSYGLGRVIMSPMKSGFTRVALAMIGTGVSAYSLAGFTESTPIAFSLGAGAGIGLGTFLAMPTIPPEVKRALATTGEAVSGIVDLYNPMSASRRLGRFLRALRGRGFGMHDPGTVFIGP